MKLKWTGHFLEASVWSTDDIEKLLWYAWSNLIISVVSINKLFKEWIMHYRYCQNVDFNVFREKECV